MPSKKAKPFVIWTLQRTGGTNLTNMFEEATGFPKVDHEPFNLSRTYGRVTYLWLNGDKKGVYVELKSIFRAKQIIKHCVENVPWKFSMRIAEVSSAAGFQNVFLYRKNSLNRLLSLEFSRRTNIWGGWAKNKIICSDEIYADPLPVSDLVAHEKRCVWILNQIWTFLQRIGTEPHYLLYEDIYKKEDKSESFYHLFPVLNKFDLVSSEEEGRIFYHELIRNGEQGTRKDYSLFSDIQKLKEALTNVKPFSPLD